MNDESDQSLATVLSVDFGLLIGLANRSTDENNCVCLQRGSVRPIVEILENSSYTLREALRLC
jgi:hypothetical protein